MNDVRDNTCLNEGNLPEYLDDADLERRRKDAWERHLDQMLKIAQLAHLKRAEQIVRESAQ